MLLKRIRVDGLPLISSKISGKQWYLPSEENLLQEQIKRIRKKHPTYLVGFETVFKPEFSTTNEARSYHNQHHMDMNQIPYAKCKDWSCMRMKRKAERIANRKTITTN